MTQDNANNFDNANNANNTNNANSFNNANNANNADEWLMMLMNNAWVKQEPHDRSVLFLNHIEIHLIMYIMIQGLNTCINQKSHRTLNTAP